MSRCDDRIFVVLSTDRGGNVCSYENILLITKEIEAKLQGEILHIFIPNRYGGPVTLIVKQNVLWSVGDSIEIPETWLREINNERT